jgi:hypothetical protein
MAKRVLIHATLVCQNGCIYKPLQQHEEQSRN